MLKPPDDQALTALAATLADRLLARGARVITAESCTGGWIAKVMTDLPGSSAWFEAGVVAYSYAAKQTLLGVCPETLERHGAVSRDCVIEMAAGALARYDGDFALAVTGIAGPTGASPDKPLGSVWIAWQARDGTFRAELFHFAGDREAVRRQAVAAALRGMQALIV